MPSRKLLLETDQTDILKDTVAFFKSLASSVQVDICESGISLQFADDNSIIGVTVDVDASAFTRFETEDTSIYFQTDRLLAVLSTMSNDNVLRATVFHSNEDLLHIAEKGGNSDEGLSTSRGIVTLDDLPPATPTFPNLDTHYRYLLGSDVVGAMARRLNANKGALGQDSNVRLTCQGEKLTVSIFNQTNVLEPQISFDYICPNSDNPDRKKESNISLSSFNVINRAAGLGKKISLEFSTTEKIVKVGFSLGDVGTGNLYIMQTKITDMLE